MTISRSWLPGSFPSIRCITPKLLCDRVISVPFRHTRFINITHLQDMPDEHKIGVNQTGLFCSIKISKYDILSMISLATFILYICIWLLSFADGICFFVMTCVFIYSFSCFWKEESNCFSFVKQGLYSGKCEIITLFWLGLCENIGWK